MIQRFPLFLRGLVSQTNSLEAASLPEPLPDFLIADDKQKNLKATRKATSLENRQG